MFFILFRKIEIKLRIFLYILFFSYLIQLLPPNIFLIQNHEINLSDTKENIFKILKNPQNLDYNFFKKLCCNFDLLEEKYLKYHK